MAEKGKHTNKVLVNGETILDLTQDTVTPATLAKGATAHDKSGSQITGTLSGYDTSDATVTAGDMSYGVVAYGKDGKVYGGVPTIDGNSEKDLGDSTVGFHEGFGEIQLAKRIPRLGILFREGSTVILRASPSEFGDATAADVANGKTFTSAAGLKVVGTAEGSAVKAAQLTVTLTRYNNSNKVCIAYPAIMNGSIFPYVSYTNISNTYTFLLPVNSSVSFFFPNYSYNVARNLVGCSYVADYHSLCVLVTEENASGTISEDA